MQWFWSYSLFLFLLQIWIGYVFSPNGNSKLWHKWCKSLSSKAIVMVFLLPPPLQTKMDIVFVFWINAKMCSFHLCLHFFSKFEVSKLEVRFVSIQSFCYCHFLSKPKACVMLFSSLNTHLGCCLHFCFVSKHEGQECLSSSSPHFFGSWLKPLHLKVCNYFVYLNCCHLGNLQ